MRWRGARGVNRREEGEVEMGVGEWEKSGKKRGRTEYNKCII